MKRKKVFLGWSGDLSRQLADAFHDWIKCVLQDVDPYLSARDIDVGTQWQAHLTDALKECSFGVFFLTPENLDNKWMHFEAGALLKQVGKSKVCPFLFDAAESALDGPFAIFQAIRFGREDMLHLVLTINKSLSEPVAEATLQNCFDTYWPTFQHRLLEIKSKGQRSEPSLRVDPRTLEAAEFREIAVQFLGHNNLHAAGLRDVFESRRRFLFRMREEIEAEGKRLVIIGSSLKGLIGVGGGFAGEENLVRIAIIDALKRNVGVSILMTNPEVAHHRSLQEGREKGEIEKEIIENLIYFLKERLQCHEVNQNIAVKLYNGTPTVFLFCTSRTLLFNPYTFYSKGYESFCFLADASTKLFEHYHQNHYLAAWNDKQMTEEISNEAEVAAQQVRKLILANNQHGDMVIPNKEIREALLHKVEELVPGSAPGKRGTTNGACAVPQLAGEATPADVCISSLACNPAPFIGLFLE